MPQSVCVNREMLARQQPFDPRLRQYGGEEFGGNLAIQQPVAVGRGARMVPHRVINPQPAKPPEQQIKFDPLHQLPLRAHRIEGLQQHGPQSFSGGIDGRPRPEYRASNSPDSAASAVFAISRIAAADAPFRSAPPNLCSCTYWR